ncbi:hypothetical protein FKM82_015196 [Ascaphus truei]
MSCSINAERAFQINQNTCLLEAILLLAAINCTRRTLKCKYYLEGLYSHNRISFFLKGSGSWDHGEVIAEPCACNGLNISA